MLKTLIHRPKEHLKPLGQINTGELFLSQNKSLCMRLADNRIHTPYNDGAWGLYVEIATGHCYVELRTKEVTLARQVGEWAVTTEIPPTP